MPLVQLNLPDVLPPVPPDAAKLIADAQERIDALVESHLDKPIHAFVPSDYPLVYRALRHVADLHLAAGPLLCEWGSGTGVVTCLAAMIGFDASGIEFEGELVDMAVRLAADHRLSASFYKGNLVPHRGQRIADDAGDLGWLAVGGENPYDEMGLEINDFDVVFAYPWPGEQRVLERLFERFAADGALLMTYNGIEGIRLYRKRASR